MDFAKSLSFRGYLVGNGWSEWIETESKSESKTFNCGISALEIKHSSSISTSIQSFIQEEGWSKEVQNEEVCGNTSSSNKIQAIRIKLNNIKGYHIFYRVYLDNEEWSFWRRDFEIAGVVYGNHYITSIVFGIID